MAFLNSIFPLELASIDSNDTWENSITVLGSGAEQRNIAWGDSKRLFDASTAEHLTIPQLALVRKHFNAMRGSGFAYPLRDRSFFQAATEPFGTGDGADKTFQLTINDGNAVNAYNREIYLPETGSIHIYDNGVDVVEGVGAGKFTLAYSGATGGLVTFGTAPATGHILTWTGNFYLPVRYTTRSFPGASMFIWREDGTGLFKGAALQMTEVRYTAEF